jgi:hypothetical protein
MPKGQNETEAELEATIRQLIERMDAATKTALNTSGSKPGIRRSARIAL